MADQDSKSSKSESDLSPMENLYSDLLSLILSRLPVVSYIRSGAVCKSWRQATGDHHPSAKRPWLMFPSSTLEEGFVDPDSFRFFAIPNLASRRICLPQIVGKWIAGSSNGFVAAANPNEILLLDPVTGAEVHLPPATLLDENGELKYPTVKKVVFSPSSSTALALWVDDDINWRGLSFARARDDVWTMLNNGKYFFVYDVIIHRSLFYVVDQYTSLITFNLVDGTYVATREFNGQCDNLCHWLYLLESLDGEHLLLVHRIFDLESMMTESFKVWRLDEADAKWVEMGSLGEVAVFIGSNYSTCIFTRGLPGMRGNCVYFTVEPNWLLSNTDDFGFFDLGDGSIHQLAAL